VHNICIDRVERRLYRLERLGMNKYEATAMPLLDEMKPQSIRPYNSACAEAAKVMSSPDSGRACKAHYRAVYKWMRANWADQLKHEFTY